MSDHEGQFVAKVGAVYRTVVLASYHEEKIAALEAELAKLRAGQEPVALSVWYGPMPESNGKQNYTALLHRKGESLFDGSVITLDRSEYPDRVRYEADRVRHLIGELAEEPCITDYDADAHSGYVAPPKAPQPSAVPDGWKALIEQMALALYEERNGHEETPAHLLNAIEAYETFAAAQSAPATVQGVNKQLLEALEEGRRAIGDHSAPSDCYATGPLTGNEYRDLIQCPACSFISMYDAAIAAARNEGGKV